MRNVVFDACTIYNSNRGLCIQSRDIGDIENVLFANMTIQTQVQLGKWWGAGEPIYARQRTAQWPETKPRLGHVRCTSVSKATCSAPARMVRLSSRGCAQQPLEDIVFDNVRVEVGAKPARYRWRIL